MLLNNLRKYRQARGLTPAALAEASGVHVVIIRRLETEPIITHACWETLRGLSAALDVPMCRLFPDLKEGLNPEDYVARRFERMKKGSKQRCM